jgi:glycine hydroxymethyltransferase
MNTIIDPTLSQLLDSELHRQQNSINLIASENYTSPAVLAATASVLTNKYAEGYPGKRYYAGCTVVDQVERLAIERCKQLFGVEHVNVQPHAGSQANMAVYLAALKPGDTILGMSLAAGGHLTHGHMVNISGMVYKSVQYDVDPTTELLDYAQIEQLAHIHKPKLIIVGASAYSRTFDFEKFAAIAKSVGALLHADIAHIAGLVAAGVHPTPVGHADFITSTTHKTLRGPRGGLVMSTAAQSEAVDRVIRPGSQGGPFMHVIAAKAAAFYEALQPEFARYQRQIIENAKNMACAFKNLDYRIVTGGTDNHMFVIDLRNKGISGRAGELALEKAGITVSRSCIPFDPAKPWITSGIRIGMPAITTRGLKNDDIHIIVEYIDAVITHHENDSKLLAIRAAVKKICEKYPLPYIE